MWKWIFGFAVVTMLLGDGDKCTKTPSKSAYLQELGLSFKKNKKKMKKVHLSSEIESIKIGQISENPRSRPGFIPDLDQRWLKNVQSAKKKVCTGFREYEAFSEETLLKLAYIGYFQCPNLAVWPKNVSHSRFWGFSSGIWAWNWYKTWLLSLTPLMKILQISSLKYFSVKPPNLDIGNNLYMRVLKGFLLKMLHILGNLCTLFFCTFEHFSAISGLDPGWILAEIGDFPKFVRFWSTLSPSSDGLFPKFLIFLEAET